MDTLSKKLVDFKKELKNIKNNQTEMKKYNNWHENTLEGIKNRSNETEEWSRGERVAEITINRK